MFYVCNLRRRVAVEPRFLSKSDAEREILRAVQSDRDLPQSDDCCALLVMVARTFSPRVLQVHRSGVMVCEVLYRCIVQKVCVGDTVDGKVIGFSESCVSVSIGRMRAAVSRFFLPQGCKYDQSMGCYVDTESKVRCMGLGATVRIRVTKVFHSESGPSRIIGTMAEDYLGPVLDAWD